VYIYIALMGKSVSTYVISTNVSSRGSICDVTLGDDSTDKASTVHAMKWMYSCSHP